MPYRIFTFHDLEIEISYMCRNLKEMEDVNGGGEEGLYNAINIFFKKMVLTFVISLLETIILHDVT